jgi:hypothetical protein
VDALSVVFVLLDFKVEGFGIFFVLLDDLLETQEFGHQLLASK